jgi:hypothetical protein
MRSRCTRWIRSIVIHNTKNIPTVVKPGVGPTTNVGERVVHFWSTNPKPAGAHIVVDHNAYIYCLTDLVKDAAYHAGSMNEVSIGIEIYEDSQGVVYSEQLSATVNLVIWLCKRFRIQMQMPLALDNSEIPRIRAGGKDCVGVFGHCHNDHKDKANDPGLDIFKFLAVAGFKEFNFSKCSSVIRTEDVVYWYNKQLRLGLNTDGIPGPETCDALQVKGFVNGLYDFKTAL